MTPHRKRAPIPLRSYLVTVRCADSSEVTITVKAMTAARARTVAFVELRKGTGPEPREALSVFFVERCAS